MCKHYTRTPTIHLSPSVRPNLCSVLDTIFGNIQMWSDYFLYISDLLLLNGWMDVWMAIRMNNNVQPSNSLMYSTYKTKSLRSVVISLKSFMRHMGNCLGFQDNLRWDFLYSSFFNCRSVLVGTTNISFRSNECVTCKSVPLLFCGYLIFCLEREKTNKQKKPAGIMPQMRY